ncbi:MAG: MFS transporter, partial [Acidobacteriaceae bacterium]
AWAKLLFSPDPNNALAAYALIGFTGLLLLGRLIAPWFTRRIPERVLLFSCIALAVACMALVQLPSPPLLQAIALAVSGLALAPMFPLIVSIFTKTIPQQRAWAFCASGLGAASLPWLMGVMSERIPLRLTYALPCFAFGVIFVLVCGLGAVQSESRGREAGVAQLN